MRLLGLTTFLAILSMAALGEGWKLQSAKLSPDPATGRTLEGGTLELRIPSKRSCGWWTRTQPIDPAKGGVRFTARAEISLDQAGDQVFNDLMMYVTWNFPTDGLKRKGAFFQKDFITYTDKSEGGKVVRLFDETYSAPEGCDSVTVEFIGKWHAMTAKISDVKLEGVARPKPRMVRCVVGNPHERGFRCWKTPEETIKGRLGQIETTLTNIFAHVERPDIILFAETFTDTGSPCPELTAERIPGGPSFVLAARYAKMYHTYIAMCIRERSAENTCHNSTFIVDRKGELVGVYRKTTLTCGEYQMGLLPGDDFGVFDLDFGRVGCLTCWDNWFSETAKFLRRKGAELILFPLAGCAPDHVEITFPARAIDIGIPFLVAMRQGHLPNGIIDRDGTWKVKTFEDNGFAWADLDLNERKRTFWLSVGAGQGDPYELYLDESRPELYKKQEYGPRR
ncbi:MAG: carbon-nitrogen hydrolase family protein [Kiritimatiellia bacterium]